ncbi:Riboflavin-binding protein RibY [Pandoraea horticolens]|uniref:Riboflavin-binding protein RibY n=1 Tax=Pandoraea horticolens TaxID=2508298 RepID=A0A5E4VLQ6_9BURK|nr:ABC transporter substrate-binding protein [Pandoraea horticolens]VVE13258.1 Riboflavin-binding protein RibY [Pandoraea horticolens]
MSRLSKLFSVLLVSVSLLGAAAPASAADDVIVQLDWVVRGNHAMFFVARDKGMFAKQGINVTAIRKGTGSVDALRMVANGSAQFGFGDLSTLLVARTQGVSNTALVAVNQKSPLAMVSVKARKPLNSAKDLKGMNVGVHPAGSTYVFLKAFLSKNGMSLADIKQSTVAPPYENYLVMGRVDAVPGYIDAEVPLLEEKTGGPGSLSILQAADHGLNVYGSGMFTSDKMIAANPQLVQRFVNAYTEAFGYVVAHPDEAVAAIVKANPEYKGQEKILAEQLDADFKHTMYSGDTAANGMGWIEGKRWGDMFDVLQKEGSIDASAKASGGFDMKFLTAAKPLRK